MDSIGIDASVGVKEIWPQAFTLCTLFNLSDVKQIHHVTHRIANTVYSHAQRDVETGTSEQSDKGRETLNLCVLNQCNNVWLVRVNVITELYTLQLVQASTITMNNLLGHEVLLIEIIEEKCIYI